MAAKKRGKKKAQASKVKAKKKGARGAAGAGARKKAGKKKKKAASKKVAAEASASGVKKASKKARGGKKRAARKSPAPAPEKMMAPPEAEEGLSPAEESEADDDGDDEPAPDDEEGEPPGVGDDAPAFELSDHEGKRFSSEALAGKPYVLYFYPKDDTPGCTREACDFRDARASFEAAGIRVVGVSPDSAASHGKFGSKYQLNFPLLADVDRELTKAYGAWVLKKNYGREYMGVERSTFLVGADGKLKQIWRGVRVNGHVAAVQEAAASL